MRSLLAWCIPAATAIVLIIACGDATTPSGSPFSETPGPTSSSSTSSSSSSSSGSTDVDNGFESDDPSGRVSDVRPFGSSSGTSGAPPLPTEGARVVEEADIIKVDGNLLYALSNHGGLSIVDVTDASHMVVLARKHTSGTPLDLYVQNGKAYVIVNEGVRWLPRETGVGAVSTVGSQVVSFDVSNPRTIEQEALYDVPGNISDSRLVGDVLYLVTYENGSCLACGRPAGTFVTSFNVANRQIAKVDELTLRPPSNTHYGLFQRSVSATNQRLYIAGPDGSVAPGGATPSPSIIQVVDITDPTGKLTKGAEVAIAGQINSRWQLDEDSGVLRVVSQHTSPTNPTVETFTVASAQSITPLGKTDIVLAQPESLTSVRFDGRRAYALTSRQSDPLYTIDLADPAHPKQVGELKLPGWVFHVEPRGDRLVGIGYDHLGTTSLAASLIDVGDLAHPTLLKAVSFGQGLGSFAEDQDRIHKSVRVLDEQGLVLVPFASRGAATNCTTPQNGVQLIDYARNDLVLRGLAVHDAPIRRAITLPNTKLLAVSDRNVTSFDIASRAAPVKSHEVDLASPSYRVVETTNGYIAAISDQWWTSEPVLTIMPKTSTTTTTISAALARLSLKELVPANTNVVDCTTASEPYASFHDARLFAKDNYVYLAVLVSSSIGATQNKVVAAAIDISNPAQPKIAGKVETALDSFGRGTSYGIGYFDCGINYDGWSFFGWNGGSGGNLVSSGEGVVQHGTKLAYIENLGRTDKRVLHVVDFVNPAAPVEHVPVALPKTVGLTTPLHLSNGIVMTSRWVPSEKSPGKVRFFVDRIDLNGATPVQLPSINAPGSLVLVDPVTNRFVTVDYSTTRSSAPDLAECYYSKNGRGIFEHTTQECSVTQRALKLSDVVDTKVSLRQTFELPSQSLAGVLPAEDRLYITHYRRYDSRGPTPALLESAGLWTIAGARAGNLSVVSELERDVDWPLAASGSKVALATLEGLQICDTAAAVSVLLATDPDRGWRPSSFVKVGPDHTIASSSRFGLQTIRY